MGFFSNLKSSFSKSKRLKDISKRLAQASSPTLDIKRMMTQSSEKKEILQELYELCENDKQLSVILKKHNATREDLFNIYRVFMSNGGGQWARGHYVAVSIFAFAGTLDYCLSKELNSREEVLNTVYRMIEYFEKGEMGFPRD